VSAPPRIRLVPPPPAAPAAKPPPPTPLPAPASDELLVSACASGDGEALGALFDRHAVAVYRFLSRYTGAGHPDLDPLVNDTFLEVYRSAHRFRGHAAAKTWIIAVAANVARHYMRGESRRRAFLSALGMLPAARAVEAEALVERRDLVRRLEALVGSLPHDLRVVYVMCDLEELPGGEVARALSIPQGTLWRRLHEARRALRSSLDREGHA
jgi:RNA polymerase sigma factor (sigma-70 family)